MVATDDDAGPETGRVSYRIVRGNEAKLFSLNGQSGEVKTVGSLDYEGVKFYKLVIEATDHDPNSPLTSQVDVSINVTDINDHGPIMNPDNYQTGVREDANISTMIERIYATDEDSGLNSKLAFYFPKDTDHGGKFAIDKDTGKITVASALDREVQDSYTISITVADMGGEEIVGKTKYDQGYITIKVVEVNDNYPIFDKGTESFVFPEDTPIGTTVTKVRATDGDSVGQLVPMSYYISPSENGGHDGTVAGDYLINPSTGVIKINKEYDFEAEKARTFTVVASDGLLKGYRKVVISITDVGGTDIYSTLLYVFRDNPE